MARYNASTPGSRLPPWQLFLVLVGISAGLVVTGPASPAAAHATLLFTTPAFDSAVPSSPAAIELVFDQPVEPSASSLSVADTSGDSYDLGDLASGSDVQTMTARVNSVLPPGEYTVRWQVVADDGDAMLGEYHFAVGSSAGLTAGGATTATEGVRVTAALRWLMFIGLALTLGGMVGRRLARFEDGIPGTTNPRPWVGPGLAVGGFASVGLALLVIGSGSIFTAIDSADLGPLISSTAGRLATLSVVAFMLAAVLVWRGRWGLAGLALLLVPLSEGLRGHPHGAAGAAGAILTAVHLTGAVVWVGALVHVIRVGRSWREHHVSVRAVVRDYSRLALWLFLTVVVTGIVASVFLIPADKLFTTLAHTTYGGWLVVKLVLVAVAAALALLARRAFARGSDRGQPARATVTEAASLLVILGISGLLTALVPPTRNDASLPYPPPAVGSVEMLGGRAGFIGIGVVASGGQLLVRLTTPDDTATDGVTNPGESFELMGNVTDHRSERVTTLQFRRCGGGCFVAPLSWSPGMSTVTLAASAENWPGGTTSVNVSWPAHHADAALIQVTKAMRDAPGLELVEQVTSDTRQGLGTLRSVHISGQEFLGVEPYGSGKATSVTLVGKTGGQRTLALGYPAEGTFILLTIDADDRIIRETLTAPEHLVTRRFIYPEPGHPEPADNDQSDARQGL